MHCLFSIIAMVLVAALPAAAQSADVDAVIAVARDADIVILGEIHDNPQHHANQAAIIGGAAAGGAGLRDDPAVARGRGERPARRGGGRRRDRGGAGLGARAAGRTSPTTRRSWRRRRRRGCSAPASRPRTSSGRWRRERRRSSGRMRRPTVSTSRSLRTSRRRGRRCRPRRTATRFPRSCCREWSRRSGSATRGWPMRRSGRGRMTGDGQVVVITGSGHADKTRGMPAALAVAAPDLKVLSVGQFEAPPGEAGSSVRPDPAGAGAGTGRSLPGVQGARRHRIAAVRVRRRPPRRGAWRAAPRRSA